MYSPNYDVSPERKATYYIGMAIMAVGFLIFISVFFSQINSFGNFDNFHGRAQSSMTRAFVGMILIVIGGVVKGIGKRGLAGSGVILDPQQEREDMEPWSRMSGGMTNDAMSEIDLVNNMNDRLTGPDHGSKETIKVRCRECRTLNDEDAKFCDECGAKM